MAMLTPEGIARRILSLYEDYYNDSLDTVEAAWEDTQDIILHDFEMRRITADPANLANFTQFPALAIGVGELREDETGDQRLQQYYSYYLLTIDCVYFLRSLDLTELGLVLLRHVQATLHFLNQHPRLDYERDVSIRNVRIEASGNALPSGGNALAKGLRVRFDVRFIQSGL